LGRHEARNPVSNGITHLAIGALECFRDLTESRLAARTRQKGKKFIVEVSILPWLHPRSLVELRPGSPEVDTLGPGSVVGVNRRD
jgi:hypothetical protein